MDSLRVAFIPFSAPGHMNPLMDIARIFARHGVDVTCFITTANVRRFQDKVESDFNLGYKIKIHTLSLPYAEVGLPPGVENFSETTSTEMFGKLMQAFKMLENDTEKLLFEMKADCIVSDVIHHWTTDAATRLQIPRIAFQCAGYIAQSIPHAITLYDPHEKIESETEPFVLPGLPHKIKITRSEIPFWVGSKDKIVKEAIEKLKEMERKSLGVLMNTFYELEPDYVKYYESSIGMRSWAIGPVSLWFNNDVQKRIEKSEIIEWLDTKESNSVLYVSFGSMTRFPDTQLLEIAHALESSSHQFIWVIGNRRADGEGYLPEGFEQRMTQGKKGLIIRNWAPQILILNHPAIAGFLTHCGWNSTIESICLGQPIISWPLTADQFYIEKLVTQVLKIAVGVGSKKWWDINNPEDLEIIKREEIGKAVMFFMSGGKEVEEMRKRARDLRCAANKAIGEGGSSHTDLVSLMDELKTIKSQRQINQIN